MSYKRWSFIAIFLFSIGLAFGFATTTSIASLISEDIAALEEYVGILASFPLPLIAILIFLNNALTLVISFALSPILCLAPILVLVLNGWLITFLSTVILQEKSLGFLLVGLLPHGIFELPALILGEAAALSFGTMAMLALLQREKRNLLLPSLKQNLRYLIIAFTLLVPAAIIETFITPLLLNRL